VAKSTAEEVCERVEFTRELLAAGRNFGEIKRQLRAKFGEIGHRQIARYVARAREKNLKVLGIPRPEAVADSYNFYLSVIADPKATDRDRLQARLLIDKLLGLQLKLPPLEVLSAHLGITVEQLVRFIGEHAGQGISRGALAAPEAPGPDEGPG
jgi:hypothetical protein